MLTEQLGPAAVFYEFYSMRPSDREKIQRRRRGFDKMFRQLVSEGIADGSIAPCDPKLAVFWFMGSVSGIPAGSIRRANCPAKRSPTPSLPS